jgi:hypothetical protein
LAEIKALLTVMEDLKHRAVLMITYSAGLRISETARLKVSDIDSKRMMVRVQQGEGYKDRYTILSQIALDCLRQYWRAYRPKEWLFEGQKEGTHICCPTAIGLSPNSSRATIPPHKDKSPMRTRAKSGIKSWTRDQRCLFICNNDSRDGYYASGSTGTGCVTRTCDKANCKFTRGFRSCLPQKIYPFLSISCLCCQSYRISFGGERLSLDFFLCCDRLRERGMFCSQAIG